jgi:putative hydrolase of the HAD superfamily
VRLGLAANQPASIIARLDGAGIGRFFSHREVSAIHGYRKPDVRLFLRACEALDVQPPDCVMVGDRIDNDIAPARLLGMRTILFRTGRHIHQQARTWEELPDIEVETAAELRVALLRMLDGGTPAAVLADSDSGRVRDA